MKTAVITFGRMNPPTIGHEKLVNKVRAVARLESGDPLIFLSHTQNAKKDPLDYSTKISLATKAFGKIVKRSKSNTIIKVMQELENKYDNVILVVGSDRLDEMRTFLTKYNGKDYTFDSIKVVSAGERDPDAEGVSGMSASRMREYAKQDNIEEFTKGLPNNIKKDAKKIMNKVRKVLK